MKHYLDAEGGCDGPSETRARPSSSQRAQPSKHRATSPYQVDAGRVVSGYWEPEEPSQLCRGVIAAAGRWRFCVPARYGLNASACGHAVQFPQLLALPRATWTLCARVRSNRHRLWSGGLLQTGDASQGAGVMHSHRPADRGPRGSIWPSPTSACSPTPWSEPSAPTRRAAARLHQSGPGEGMEAPSTSRIPGGLDLLG